MKKDIQVKFNVYNIRRLIDKIQELNYVLVGGNFEKITRYDDEHENLSKQGVFIRTKSGINEILTIKEKITDSNNFKYFERETLNMEVENCDILDYIFKKIGLTKLFVMEKYSLTFRKGKSTISIDELPFGVYCNINDTEINIDKLLKYFNVKKIYNTTYWEIHEEKTGMKNTQSITFDKNHVFMLTSL